MSTIYKSDTGASRIQQRYTELLDSWPVPAEQHMVPTGLGETFVLACGPQTAPPLVLVHGSGANSAMWRADIASWAQHFRTYSIDLLGEPGRSAPVRPALDSAAVSEWFDEVLNQLGITTTAIVASSLGGWTALDYATLHPERVNRLALLCPGGIGRQKYGWLPAAIALRPFGAWGVRRSAALVTGLRDAATLDEIALVFREFNPRTEHLPVFSDAALRRLTMPVQLTVGARDAMLDSAESARRIRHCVPHATVRVLPGVGHAIFGQTEPIRRFLLG